MTSTQPTRWDKSKAARKQKVDTLFRGKRFQVRREVHLPLSKRFQTPLGHWGRDGFVLEEEGNPENRFFVGIHLLAKAVREYDAIVNPPAVLPIVKEKR